MTVVVSFPDCATERVSWPTRKQAERFAEIMLWLYPMASVELVP